MRIALRAQAGPTIGAGHAMRCATLASALAAAGHTVVAVIDTTAGFVDDRLDHPGIERLTPTADVSGIELIGRCDDFDAVVFDGYGLEDEVRSLAHGPIVVLVDDNAELPVELADIVLNQNLHGQTVPYPRSERTRWLIGANYALLRPEVTALSDLSHGGSRAALLVAMGGTDPGSLSLPLVEHLSRSSTDFGDVRVAVGSTHVDYVSIVRLIDTDDRLSFADPDLTGAFGAAAVAIIGAGSTMWELALLGTPSVGIVVADNQEAASLLAQESGFTTRIDARRSVQTLAGRIEIANVAAREAQNIRSSPARWTQMSEAGRNVFDGRGTARVVEAIEEVVAEQGRSIVT